MIIIIISSVQVAAQGDETEDEQMIVCVCEGVSDREITAAIQSGSRTMKELHRACGAGGDCRQCCSALRQMLRDATASGDTSTMTPPTVEGCRAA